MNESNNLMNNVMQYSSAGGTFAATIGYRVSFIKINAILILY